MKRIPLVLPAVALVLAVLPSTAIAKGPIEATIDGPGLDSPITIAGVGDDAMAPLSPIMQLAEATGFFPAAFGGQIPNPMLERRPAGDLGPRYVVEYRVPGPEGTEDVIRQDLYPYAKPVAVTYMTPGQKLFLTRTTQGGWFAGTSTARRPLLDILVEAGLPRTPPGPSDGSPFPWPLVAVLAAVGAALAGGAAALMLARRRPGEAATSA